MTFKHAKYAVEVAFGKAKFVWLAIVKCNKWETTLHGFWNSVERASCASFILELKELNNKIDARKKKLGIYHAVTKGY